MDGKLALRDSWLLESDSLRPLASKMAGFNCLATLYVIGPKLDQLVQHLIYFSSTEKIKKRHGKQESSEGIIWSVSNSDGMENAVVLRAAAQDTHLMRSFLLYHLQALPDQVPIESFSRI